MTTISHPGPQPTSLPTLQSTAALPATESQLQSALDHSIWYLLSLWPALHVACQNNWGGPDSADKKDWFAGAVSELVGVPSPAVIAQRIAALERGSANGVGNGETETLVEDTVDVDYLADFLVQIMTDEFDCNVEDDTELNVARDILAVRERLWRERTTVAAKEVEARWRNRGQLRSDVRVQEVDQEVDGEVEIDGDGDEEMGEAPMLVPVAEVREREKVVPEVDEEGFTKVVSKKKR